MNLAALQNEFAKALHYQSRGEACGIVSDHFSADERIQIYRNNFIIGLSEVLQATYPTVQALLGEECFLQIARQHVLSHPLTKGDVTEYGAQFEQTLQQFEAVMQAAPYCAEMARFEWAFDISQQRFSNVAPPELLPLTKLAQLAPEQHASLCFHLPADVELIESRYALFSLHHAVETNDFDNLKIDLPEQGMVVTQDNGVAIGRALSNNDYRLLQQLQKTLPVGKIEPQLLSSLNSLMALGTIVGFSLPQQ